MATATIDFSLDLGVTNSRIAVARNGVAQVVLTGEGLECTPTAVWCDERERLIVGSQTRDRLVDDAANVAERFMAQLGTGEVFRFARQNRPAEPEDLAAEVIGSLRADARRRTGRDVSAAVLTAPAGFAAAQRDAVIAAARKAGVAVSPLLQEPVAAALAYGGPAADAQLARLRLRRRRRSRQPWSSCRTASCKWRATPATRASAASSSTGRSSTSCSSLPSPRSSRWTSFRRDNPKWRIAVAKLKVAAEEARIHLDHESGAQVMVPFLCRDDSGAPVRFRHTLTRSELEDAAGTGRAPVAEGV